MIRKKKHSRAVLVCVMILTVILCTCGFYLGTYYHAAESAVATAELDALDVQMPGQNVLFFGPEQIDSDTPAVIFYPGGKVQMEAYAPLCKELADRGILCALVKMPFNLAVFDINAAGEVETFMEETFSCDDFYLGGHSLGGAMASTYAAGHTDDIQGVIFLGAYAAKDLSDTDLRILSIYGSEDKVLSADKYAEALANVPSDFTEQVIPGGCHGHFGDYGAQKGDGTPTITGEEQRSETADLIAEWLDEWTASRRPN